MGKTRDLFKESRDPKGIFHEKMGTMKDRNVMDLIEAEDIKKFSSVQSLSCVHLCATQWTAARQASLTITNSQSLLKLISIELVMPSNHLILCYPLPLLPSIFPSLHYQHIIILATMSTGETDGLQGLCERFPTESFTICLCPSL